MRVPALLAALALATGLLAGCGDDGGGGAPAAGTEGQQGVQVGMRNLRFDPERVTVQAGEKVVWTNGESIQHNVVAQQGADFESELLDQGGTYEFTPQDAGTIEYVCTLHPGMDGTITVSD